MESTYREDHPDSSKCFNLHEELKALHQRLKSQHYLKLVKQPCLYQPSTSPDASECRLCADKYMLEGSTEDSQHYDCICALFVLMTIHKHTAADAIRIVKAKLSRWLKHKPYPPADIDDFAAGYNLEAEAKKIADGLKSGRLLQPSKRDPNKLRYDSEYLNLDHIYNAVTSSQHNAARCTSHIRLAAYLSAMLTDKPHTTSCQFPCQELSLVTGSTKAYTYTERLNDIAPSLGISRGQKFQFNRHPDTAVSAASCKTITIHKPAAFILDRNKPHTLVDIEDHDFSVAYLLHECGQSREQIAEAFRLGGWTEHEFDEIYEDQVERVIKYRHHRNASRKRYSLAALSRPAKIHTTNATRFRTEPLPATRFTSTRPTTSTTLHFFSRLFPGTTRPEKGFQLKKCRFCDTWAANLF